ncbi:MAG TPA: Sec-dependent nitrous-oxide reductase [Vicinamibacteria bacterium]|nr:Sec-dependent nitrous-oxide reductase [Vicinamibacteria bacterium]HRB12349.1 Sec-dependent nitrous-oxide reductase [Vicinamibacteria bacterium]
MSRFGILALAVFAVACAPSAPKGAQRAGGGATSDVAIAAQKTYVAPGDLDEYYMFSSGGHSGQVYVYGVPSMRHLSTIPVYTPYPATGYGFDDESKKMLGDLTWGDVHHPSLSETNGDYDGRWLFVNEMNGRLARIDLRDFKTKQIIGPIPNVSGNHASAFVTPNSEYSVMASRFSIPIPKGTVAGVDKYATDYKGVITGIKIDPKSGEMSFGWQIVMPPFDYDLGDAGKKVSNGYVFFTSYNTEKATGKLEVTSTQKDRDYIAMVDWKLAEKSAAEGKGKMIGGVKVLDPKEIPGLVYFLPCGKSPHGVDVAPDGNWIVGSGKLQGVTTVFNMEKIQTAIKNKNFTGDEDGIPVLKYEDIKDAEVTVGLGPLHTQFGPDNWAYTSLFVDSAIAKWKLGTWEVVDKAPMSYSIGHLSAAEGDTVSPDGKYLVGLNKLSHGRHLSVGPSQPESSQLVDISEEKMKLIYDAFTEPEPHYAQIIKADKVKPIEVYPKEENKHPYAVWDVKDAGVTRNGNKVLVKMVAVRSTLTPTDFEVKAGDEVTIAVTNIEQTTDELHGFGLLDYNINIVVDPGETKQVTFKAKKSGVFPFYCTNFCSALHQEMQGYFIVR